MHYGVFLMPREPEVKRVFSFIDGQNLYFAAKEAYGYSHPNYDVLKLSRKICEQKKWELEKVLFYTGIPDPRVDKFWHDFWVAKMAVMGTRGIKTYSRQLKYHYQEVEFTAGEIKKIPVPREKGIDIRIALDVVHYALAEAYDVALIFSQDQDLSEVARELKRISKHQNRWIKCASAYPTGSGYQNNRGINQTDWIRINKTLYDECIDPNDYRSGYRKSQLRFPIDETSQV